MLGIGHLLVVAQAATFMAPWPEAHPPAVHKVAVFKNDGRKKLEADKAPWRAIGRLTLPSGKKCTASLVGESVILTAASCVVDEAEGKIAGGADEYLFTGGQSAPGSEQTAKIEKIAVGTFSPSTEPANNWAVLVIAEPLGKTLGFLGVTPLPSEKIADINTTNYLYAAGFSADWKEGERPHWEKDKKIFGIKEDGYGHHVFSMGDGAVGAPLFIFKEQGSAEGFILGMHIGVDDAAMHGWDDENLAVLSKQFLGKVIELRGGR